MLVKEGLKAGVDTLKFHLLFDVEDYVIGSHKAREKLKDIQISTHSWIELHNDLVGKNIKPIYLCNDVDSLKWVNRLDSNTVTAIEIHATGINDILLLQEAVDFEGTVILGSGGSTLDDINFAIDFLRSKGQNDILLMHGFQNYPTDYREINFSKMGLLKNIFDVPVGYTNHTNPQDDLNEYISCLPQSMGYNILEKHFTHVPHEERIDSQAAVSIKQLRKIRKLMNLLHLTHGSDPLEMSDAERKYGNTGPMKKAIVACKDLKKGTVVSINDIAYKRTNRSVAIKQRDIYNFIGAKTHLPISKDTPLTYKNVEYRFAEGDASQFKLEQE
jgi:sialic acid synthase SpsE